MAAEIKYILKESNQLIKRVTGVDYRNPKVFREHILGDDKNFSSYVSSLSEHMSKPVQEEYKALANTTRFRLLENSIYGFNPYETLAMPILSVFYPRLLARELVTVAPIDKPEVIKAFLLPKFKMFNNPNSFTGPSYNNISSGPQVTIADGTSMTVPSTINILTNLKLDSTIAHIERNFTIYQVLMNVGGTSTVVQVDIQADVDGNISAQVNGTNSTTNESVTDLLFGNINYLDGTVTLSSQSGLITSAFYAATVSLEENTINPVLELDISKIRLFVKDRQISARWSVQMEQDVKALFDIDIQAEIVTVLGQQIALDIDREIVTNLLFVTTTNQVNANHIGSFSKNPEAGYTWGPKQWWENIIPQLSMLSAAIYSDTNIQAGDTIACNPLDAAIYESLNGFQYNGSTQEGGDIGYRSATIQGGKWKILTSPVVPQGQQIITYKPDVELKSVYYYAPYVPAILEPFPLGAKPSLTVLSRYANALVRPLGLARLNIV